MESAHLLKQSFWVYHRAQFLGHCYFLFVWMSWHACPPLTDSSQCVLYADNLLLFWAVKDHMDIQNLQNDVTLIEEWIKHNYLTLYTSRYKSMIVSRKKSWSYSFTLTLGSQQLEVVESFKYLGVLLSSNLSFSQHIQTICTKARKILGLVYRWFYKNTTSAMKPCYSYISLWLDHTLNMPVQYETLTWKRTSNN